MLNKNQPKTGWIGRLFLSGTGGRETSSPLTGHALNGLFRPGLFLLNSFVFGFHNKQDIY